MTARRLLLPLWFWALVLGCDRESKGMYACSNACERSGGMQIYLYREDICICRNEPAPGPTVRLNPANHYMENPPPIDDMARLPDWAQPRHECQQRFTWVLPDGGTLGGQ